MSLSIHGRQHRVAQLAPDYVIFAQPPPPCPPGVASMCIRVDGEEDHFTVHLPVGLIEGQKRTPIEPLAL